MFIAACLCCMDQLPGTFLSHIPCFVRLRLVANQAVFSVCIAAFLTECLLQRLHGRWTRGFGLDVTAKVDTGQQGRCAPNDSEASDTHRPRPGYA